MRTITRVAVCGAFKVTRAHSKPHVRGQCTMSALGERIGSSNVIGFSADTADGMINEIAQTCFERWAINCVAGGVCRCRRTASSLVVVRGRTGTACVGGDRCVGGRCRRTASSLVRRRSPPAVVSAAAVASAVAVTVAVAASPPSSTTGGAEANQPNVVLLNGSVSPN